MTFVPGHAASNTSSLVASPNSVVANGTSTTTLSFTALDAYNNLVPGTAVSLSASGGNNTFGATSGTTNSSGVFTTTLASTYAQSENVTASFGSGLSVTTIVQFVPGAANITTSSLVLSPNSQVANNSNIITALLTLNDAQGNPISNITPTFAASGSATSVSSPPATSAAGQSSATYQTTLAQNENALVTGGNLSFIAPMVFVAGPPNAAASTLAANPNIASGDGSATVSLTATVRDAQGNLVSGASVAFSASGGNNTFAATNGNTSTSGTFTTTLTSNMMQTESITALIAGNLTEVTSVTFTGNPNATTSTLAVSPNSTIVGPNNFITATLTLKDAASNPLANVSPTWTGSGGNNLIASGNATSSSGIATATYSSTLAQKENVIVSAGGLSLSQGISFMAGSPNSTRSQIRAMPTQQLANNVDTILVKAIFLDAYQNPIIGASPTFSVSGSSTSFSTTTATDINGEYRGTFKSSVVQNENISATLKTAGLSVPVTFTDIPTSCNLIASPSSVVGDGNTELTLNATYQNAAGTGVANLSSKFSSVGSSSIDLNRVSTTNSAGQALFKIKSLYAGPNKFFAQAGNITCSANANFTLRSTACANSPNFVFSATVPVGSTPQPPTLGDFNNDGLTDLLSVSYDNTAAFLSLGHGDGTFATVKSFPVGNQPWGSAAGDVNNDGNLDLIVGNYADKTVGVLYGSPSGDLGKMTTYALDLSPFTPVVSDFNNDGALDIAVDAPGKLYILMNQGDGTFMPATSYSATNSSSSYTTTVGDFNKDGIKDLVVSVYNAGQVNLYLGQGDGSFATPTSFAVDSSPGGSIKGDFNEDGNEDLAVLGQSNKTFSLLLGNGSGSFSAYTTTSISVGSNFASIGDFNGDGHQDLVAASEFNSSFAMILGNGTGTFGAPISFTYGTTNRGTAVADFNNDGLQDIAVTNRDPHSVTVVLNSGCH